VYSKSIDLYDTYRAYSNIQSNQFCGVQEAKYAVQYDNVTLILSKIHKIVATRCHILRLKCTQFDLGWGCAPKPTQGVLPRSSIAGYKGTAFKGREESERKGRGS